MENARLHEEVASHEAKLARDLADARQLQQGLLDTIPKFPGIDISARNTPATAVSGDFYDFLQLEPDLLRIFIGDVSGKGAPAALFAALTSGIVRHISSSNQSPASMLEEVNRFLVSLKEAAPRYVAATAVDWQRNSQSLTISNAGAGDVIVVRNSKADTLRIEGFPLGLFATAKCEEVSLSVRPADVIVLASDGITECDDHLGNEYGTARLTETIMAHQTLDARELSEKIFESVRQHAGIASPQDDQTLIILKVSSD